jgi:hypothetical protein
MPKAKPKSIAQFYRDLLAAVDEISEEKDDVFLKARGHLEYTRQLAVDGDPKKNIVALESARLKSSCEACEAAMKEAGRAILASFPSRQDDGGKRILELKKPAHLKFITGYRQHLQMLSDGQYDYMGVYAAIMAWDPTGYVDGKKKQGKVETQKTIDELSDSEVSVSFPVLTELGSKLERPVQDAGSDDSTGLPGSQDSSQKEEIDAPSPVSSTIDLPGYAIEKVNIADADTLKATYLMLLRAYWGYDKNRMGDFCNKKARIAAFFGAFLIHILPPCLVDKPIHFLTTTRGVSCFFPRMCEAVAVFECKRQADGARVSEQPSAVSSDSDDESDWYSVCSHEQPH